MSDYNRNKGNNYITYRKLVIDYLHELGYSLKSNSVYFVPDGNRLVREGHKAKISFRLCAALIIGDYLKNK